MSEPDKLNLEKMAQQIGEYANRCCDLSDGYDTDTARFALSLLEQAYKAGMLAQHFSIQQPKSHEKD